MQRTSAIQIQRHGGPEVLEFVHLDVAPPSAGEVQIRQAAIGLNFADIYQRKGAHGPHGPAVFPLVPGANGAGVVAAVGSGVDGFSVGQPVAYVHAGAYQVLRNVPASRVVALDERISIEAAGANLLRGLTAEYLLRRLYVVRPGDAVLVHAAAGGMGVLLSQWARALGAMVIGTVGSPAKAAVALAHGCHHVIDYREQAFAPRVLELTGGEGVAVVYDAVGRDVFLPSLDCLRTRGMAINYGTASGDVEGLDLQRLHARSLSVCRPTLRSFIADPRELQAAAGALFDAVGAGHVQLEVGSRYDFSQAQRAHRELEERMTIGAPVLLVPQGQA